MAQNDPQDSNSSQIANSSETAKQEYAALVRRVSERVWELWREDLRRSRERRADPPRK